MVIETNPTREGQQDGVVTPSGLPTDEKAVIPWLLVQPSENQAKLAHEHFERLLYAAAQPRHVSGNACLKLCYYLELCTKSTSQILLDMVYSRDVCMGLFTFFVEWSEKNLHRSTRQVMELIAYLLTNNPDVEAARNFKKDMLDRGICILIGRAAQPLIKPAFKALEYMVSKKTISVSDVLDSYRRQSLHDELLNDDRTLLAFMRMVISWMSDIMPDTAPSAGRFLTSIALKVNPKSNHVQNEPIWSAWIENGLSLDPSCLENVKNYILSPIFKNDRPGALSYLHKLSGGVSVHERNGQEIDAHASFFLAALDVGKQCGVIIDTDEQGQTKKGTMALPESAVGRLLCHPLSSVRSAAFSVITHSTEATRPFSSSALSIFRDNMGTLYSDSDAKCRTEILSNTRIMIERLRSSNAVLFKKTERAKFSAKNKSSETVQDSPSANEDIVTTEAIIARQEMFLNWFLDFLAAELVPTASYPRHITALKALYLMATIESREKTTAMAMNVSKLFSAKMVRLLLDLVMDPFEDVRSTVTTLLKLAPASVFCSTKYPVVTDVAPSLLPDFLTLGDEFSRRTGRADYADGVARTHDLIFSMLADEYARLQYISRIVDELENRTRIANEDLSISVQSAPVHGLFASLRLLWEAIGFLPSTRSGIILEKSKIANISAWRDLQQRIISCCYGIWKAVEAILCDDSPEGHVLADIENEDLVDTKDILSYSFRAIHESSNLLRTLLNQRYPSTAGHETIMPFEHFEQIGSLTYQQLKDLRHRGAFSTVTLTFARCCQLTQSYTIEGGKKHLLEQWYAGTIACINEQVSTTRRSAGIPALVTGILSAKSASITLDNVMENLLAIAHEPVLLSEKDETNLPQVHAMNCIKDIFRSAVLGKRAEPFISDCLQLAADALQSDIWAVRNCGLILLRSLIDSLFGTTESKVISEAGWDGRSTRLSYDRYPGLPALLLDLLKRGPEAKKAKQAPQIGAIESVFPALDILRRAGPPARLRDEFYAAISHHLGNKIWHVRDIAARTMCTLHLTEQWHVEAIDLMKSCIESNNRCHGVMMTMKYILERRQQLKLDLNPAHLSMIVETLGNIETDLIPQGEALTSMLEVKNVILEILLSAQRQSASGYEDLEEEMILSCAESADNVNGCQPVPTVLQLRAKSIQSLLIAALYGKPDSAVAVVKNLSRQDIDTASHCLELIPRIWPLATISSSDLTQVCTLLDSAIRWATAPEIQSVALNSLADVLDHDPTLRNIMKLSSYTTFHYRTPDLNNAEIRLGGHGLSHRGDTESLKTYDARLTEWGYMLRLAGKATSDFDTRHSAILALRAFYGTLSIKHLPTSSAEAHIPALLACYDVLNDDDDEIRELGALVASKILHQNLASLAVKDKFLTWLADRYGHDTGFINEMYQRITGHTNREETSIKSQMSVALIDDDSLFVEEEQNLFIDEVRESISWCSLITSRTGTHWDELAGRLQSWTISSLHELQALASKGDGIYGPVSKPTVYTICNNVVQTASKLMSRNRELKRGEDELLRTAIVDFFVVGKKADFHPLLLSILEQSLSV